MRLPAIATFFVLGRCSGLICQQTERDNLHLPKMFLTMTNVEARVLIKLFLIEKRVYMFFKAGIWLLQVKTMIGNSILKW